MPTAPPPPDVQSWPSHAYWRESAAHVKQLWYVSFCLMMSSVQDRLTGLALQESGNLNWATTAFYYSTVHAGRLACFVCTGDYPTGHAELASLLAPVRVAQAQQPARQFHFDWLDKFRRYVGVNPPAPAGAAAPRPRPDREAITRAIDSRMPGLRTQFDRFAALPSLFKNLRNDCNYEALLVAHEVNHVTVTEGFQDLVGSADRASRLAVDLAVASYLEHIQHDQAFDASRNEFHAAHTEYLEGRFAQSLRRKFGASHAAMTELRRIACSLDWPGTPEVPDVDAFLAPTMYDTFEAKQGLMRRWRDDVDTLRSALPQQ